MSVYAADIDNPHECCTKCVETPGCMSFVLDRWQGSGKCQLYDTPDAKASNAGSAWEFDLWAYALPAAPPPPSPSAPCAAYSCVNYTSEVEALGACGLGLLRRCEGREDFLLTGIDITADECNASRAWLHQSTTFVIDGLGQSGLAGATAGVARAWPGTCYLLAGNLISAALLSTADRVAASNACGSLPGQLPCHCRHTPRRRANDCFVASDVSAGVYGACHCPDPPAPPSPPPPGRRRRRPRRRRPCPPPPDRRSRWRRRRRRSPPPPPPRLHPLHRPRRRRTCSSSAPTRRTSLLYGLVPDEQCRTVPRRFYTTVPASTSTSAMLNPGGTLDAAGNLYRVDASDPQSAVQVLYNTNGWTLPYAADAGARGTCVGAQPVTGLVNNVYASVGFSNPAQMADYRSSCGSTSAARRSPSTLRAWTRTTRATATSRTTSSRRRRRLRRCRATTTRARAALRARRTRARLLRAQPTELVECADQAQFNANGVTMYGRDCRRVAAEMYPDTLARDPSFAHAPHPADRVMDNAAGEEAIYYPRAATRTSTPATARAASAWRATTARTTTASWRGAAAQPGRDTRLCRARCGRRASTRARASAWRWAAA